MKHAFLLLAFILSTTTFCYSQGNKSNSISFDGLYIAKSGSVQAANSDIYTYLRFYRDGSVYLQAVSSYDPVAVSKWFGRYNKYSQNGIYKVDGTSVSIQLDNKKSGDYRLEGLQETTYKGTIKSNIQLCLTRDKETDVKCFDFIKVSDTTRLKYAQYKPVIKLPGEWKVKQIIEGNGQVFFTNEDSTVVAIAVYLASNHNVYKKSQSDFETAYALYDWDSKYMKEEENMEVRKISENRRKSFIFWNAKDADNDNNFLFARHEKLLFSFMIYDENMPLDKQLNYLEILYDLNKE